MDIQFSDQAVKLDGRALDCTNEAPYEKSQSQFS